MATFTYSQQRDFNTAMWKEMPDDFLDSVIAWIAKNLAPESVFDEDDLKRWADDNYDCPDCEARETEADDEDDGE